MRTTVSPAIATPTITRFEGDNERWMVGEEDEVAGRVATILLLERVSVIIVAKELFDGGVERKVVNAVFSLDTSNSEEELVMEVSC